MTPSEAASAATRPRILVIDDEAIVGLSCERILSSAGYEMEYRQDPRSGLEEALTGDYDLILLDLVMPEMDGLALFQELKDAGVTSEVVIVTGYSTVETAVDAMKLGAADYVSKPFSPEELKVVVDKVVERSALIRENRELREQLRAQQGFEGIIGDSQRMQQVYGLIRRVAPTDGTVLITGESGTGKEMVARATHRLSLRRKEPFLGFDCGALAPSLLESELFGHLKGSFSGAISTKHGLFEAADGGTLFLDEVANISLETQAKLLRALETRRIRKVGETAETEVDLRLIAATNRDLQDMVQNETFREDLFYRLNVVPIYVPPLRRRAGDIPKLAMFFLERFRGDNEVRMQGFTPEAMSVLEGYAWPGNVRELKNMVERLAILTDAERVEPGHLPPHLRETPLRTSRWDLPHKWDEFKELKKQVRDSAVREIERAFLVEALQHSGGNVSRAAEEVGMQRTQFHSLMRRYNLVAEHAQPRPDPPDPERAGRDA